MPDSTPDITACNAPVPVPSEIVRVAAPRSIGLTNVSDEAPSVPRKKVLPVGTKLPLPHVRPAPPLSVTVRLPPIERNPPVLVNCSCPAPVPSAIARLLLESSITPSPTALPASTTFEFGDSALLPARRSTVGTFVTPL